MKGNVSFTVSYTHLMVTRLAHSRSGVERKEQKPQNGISFSDDPRQFIIQWLELQEKSEKKSLLKELFLLKSPADMTEEHPDTTPSVEILSISIEKGFANSTVLDYGGAGEAGGSVNDTDYGEY